MKSPELQSVLSFPDEGQAQSSSSAPLDGNSLNFYPPTFSQTPPGPSSSSSSLGIGIPPSSVGPSAIHLGSGMSSNTPPFFGSNISGPSDAGTSPMDEPPLLEELGINFEHIANKSKQVLHPLNAVDAHLMDDTDLAGPLFFCLALGFALLLRGKVHFGYIYGVGTIGCFSMYLLLNLLTPPQEGPDMSKTASVLGYCLLPMVLLALLLLFLPSGGVIAFIFSAATVAWCSWSASSMFVSVLRMSEQRWLVLYPVALLYACFALISMF